MSVSTTARRSPARKSAVPESTTRKDKAGTSLSTGSRMVNLALQGGGSHGAFTWGVLDRILEDGRLGFEAISGTSAGSMNAVVMAYGMQQGGKEGARQALDGFWRDVAGHSGMFGSTQPTAMGNLFWGWAPGATPVFDWVKMLTGALSPYQFNPFGFNPLREVLNRHVDFDALQQAPTRLYLTATNVRTGKPKVFRGADVTADAVMASACLPTMFKAVQIGGEFYWDGGYAGNPSLYPFFYDSSCHDVLVVHINPLERDQLPILSGEIENRLNEITFNSALLSEMRAIAFVQKLLDEGWIKDEFRDQLKYIRLHSLQADDWLSDLSVASKTISDWGFLTMLRDRGRSAGSAWLEENLSSVGKRTSTDIRGRYLKH